MSTIFLFAKFLEKECFADDLLDGKLYMNTIRSFLEYPDSGENLGDQYEGVVGIFQPKRIGQISFGSVLINGSDLASPILVRQNSLLNKNVFCIYSVNSGKFSEISEFNINAFRDYIRIPEKTLELGSYCVVIKNAKEFIDRCVMAIKQAGFDGGLSPIEYYDEKEFHGYFDKERLGFQKRKLYEHQNEYRIVIDSQKPKPGPYILNIGSIKDIAEKISDNKKLNDLFNVNIPT